MSSVSDITVAALTAVPTLRGNKLAWTYSDPRSGALPNIALDMVEVHASTTNDRTGASKVGEGITDFLHSGLVEEQTWYYWIKARDMLPAANGGPGYSAWYPSGSTSGVSATAIGMAGLIVGVANGKIVASESANALTISLKTAAGNDPSVSDPIYIAFRNSTLTGGGYITRQVTAATSLVMPAGATQGVFANSPFNDWVLLIDNGGTVVIGAIVCTTPTTFFSLDESKLVTTTAVSTGADSAGVIYTTSGVTAKAFRTAGYITWNSGLSTPGNWTAHDVITPFGPGVKKPGEIIQTVANLTTTESKPSGTWSSLTAVPPNSEGFEILTTSITPQSPANWLDHDVLVYCDSIPGEYTTLAMFQDSTVNAIAAAGHRANPFSADAVLPVGQPIRKKMLAATSSSTTFKLRIGTFTGAKVAINGMLVNSTNTIVAILGSTTESGHRIAEIQG